MTAPERHSCPKCETVLPLLDGKTAECGNALPCHLHTPQKRKCGKPYGTLNAYSYCTYDAEHAGDHGRNAS